MWWIIGIIVVVVIALLIVTKKKGPEKTETAEAPGEDEKPVESLTDDSENKPFE